MALIVVSFAGRITRESVQEKLAPITEEIRGARDRSVSIIFDLLDFTDYDTECRQQYIDWHRKHARQLRRVAVLTDRVLLGSVVTAMGLAAGGHIRAFRSISDAERWCNTDDQRSSAAR